MSALYRFSQAAARRYLQSVVFVDDHIFDQSTGMPKPSIEEIPTRKRIFKRSNDGAGSGPKSIDEGAPSEAPYHPKDLVSSFAREGITCALYEPPSDFSTNADSEIFKLCEHPDIIILDWDFSGDQGTKALDLISSLVRQSSRDFPHHTRLISVYTADQSLIGVANKINDRLRKDGMNPVPEHSQYRLAAGATRLLILGKPIERFGPEEKTFTVKESKLASKLIEEFVEMNAGILPSYALHGLAAIRRNSKRILDRFHGELDGAFLLHRQLISGSEEAFDQLPELLAEEIRAVVEDERLGPSDAKKISTAALNSDHVLSQDKDLIKKILGGDAPKKIGPKVNNGGVVAVGHLRLAALFSSRTQYSSALRKLEFGTIIRHRKRNSKSAWKYAICLVPACDSLRLDSNSPVSFPFWTIEIENYTASGKRKGVVLDLSNGNTLSLSAAGTAGEKLWIDSFKVDAKTRTVVAHREKKAHRYTGCGRTIEWLGQLKPLHAHRIAQEITDNLSRIGVNEAEWLRLVCR